MCIYSSIIVWNIGVVFHACASGYTNNCFVHDNNFQSKTPPCSIALKVRRPKAFRSKTPSRKKNPSRIRSNHHLRAACPKTHRLSTSGRCPSRLTRTNSKFSRELQIQLARKQVRRSNSALLSLRRRNLWNFWTKERQNTQARPSALMTSNCWTRSVRVRLETCIWPSKRLLAFWWCWRSYRRKR